MEEYYSLQELEENTQIYSQRIQNLMRDTYNSLNKRLQEIIKKYRIEIKKQKKIEELQSYKKIKQDILINYQRIVYQVFQETFLEEYGKNYDVNSVNNSLTFGITNDLRPYINYTVVEFRIDNKIQEARKGFNQNVEDDYTFGDLMEDELGTFSNEDEIEFFGEIIDYDDPYEEAEKNVSLPTNKKVFRHKKVLVDTKTVYQKAEVDANKAFAEFYERELKNTLEKKYNQILQKEVI